MLRANDYPSEDDVIFIDWHSSGAFANTQTAARASFLGASSAPDTYFDGTDNIVGAGDSVGTHASYLPIVNTHYVEGTKYVISDAYYDFDNLDTMTAGAWFTNTIAPGETSLLNFFMQVGAYEDNVVQFLFGFPIAEPVTGNTVWNHMGRATTSTMGITAANAGEFDVFNGSFALNSAWDLDNLHLVAFTSKNNGVVKQASMMLEAHAVEVAIVGPTAGRSTGVLDFAADATYKGNVAGDVTVTLDKSGLPAGWDAEVVVGANTYPTVATIPGMTMNDLQAYSVRVISSGGPGVGTVTATTRPADGGRGRRVEYTAFYNTAAILFVDDDHSATYETEFEGAMTAAGNFFVTVDYNPTVDELSGFDAVVWNTGADQSGTITVTIQNRLVSYLNAGGRLFLSSQGYLNHMGVGPVFTTDYLGVTAFSQDAQAPTATGVALDPIGDGLSLTLSQPFPDFADAITGLHAGTAVWLNGANGDVGVRYDNGTFRTVFMSAAFEGVAPADEALVMGRILDWLTEGLLSPTGVTPLPAAAPVSLSLSQNAPNPFGRSTALRFAVPNSGPVSLSVYNVTGRRVVDLVDRVLETGSYSVDWDGRDGSGARVADGVYFYRLQSGGVSLTKEMVRLR